MAAEVTSRTRREDVDVDEVARAGLRRTRRKRETIVTQPTTRPSTTYPAVAIVRGISDSLVTLIRYLESEQVTAPF